MEAAKKPLISIGPPKLVGLEQRQSRRELLVVWGRAVLPLC